MGDSQGGESVRKNTGKLKKANTRDNKLGPTFTVVASEVWH